MSCSRDPIGYEDGYSLFGAYFVPDKLDPTGEGLDSITGSIEACLKLPNPAQRIACLKDILTPETAPHVKSYIKAQEKLRKEIIDRTNFLRRCFDRRKGLKPPKQCTPKGKAWLEWYKKVIEERLERYAKNPKTPGVVDGTKEQLRRLDIVNKMLKACE